MGGPDDGITLTTTPEMAGKLIGPGGENIRGMEQRSGAKIQIEPGANPQSERRVHIRGGRDAVKAAVAMVEDIIEAERNRFGPPGGRE